MILVTWVKRKLRAINVTPGAMSPAVGGRSVPPGHHRAFIFLEERIFWRTVGCSGVIIKRARSSFRILSPAHLPNQPDLASVPLASGPKRAVVRLPMSDDLALTMD